MKPGFNSRFEEATPRIFINRVSELKRLATHFYGGNRLLVVNGPPGSGKTALILHFMNSYRESFPDGYHIIPCGAEIPFRTIRRTFERENPRAGRHLLVLENVTAINESAKYGLYTLLQERPNLYLILISQEDLAPSFPAESISLSDPLSSDAVAELLRALIPSVADKESSLQKLQDAINGNPLSATILAAPVRNGIATLEDVESWLQKVPRPGLVGPDGRPIVSGSAEEKKVITDVRDVNDELLRMLAADPKQLLEISPRKFEEIVAELLSRRGYDVNLTRPSGDGGVDIYAARHDDVGRILYLVECKRFAPPNKVGVEIVRSLYGVVQSKRASAGMIVTTSSFTSGARQFEQELAYQMNLRDYIDLHSWLNQVQLH